MPREQVEARAQQAFRSAPIEMAMVNVEARHMEDQEFEFVDATRQPRHVVFSASAMTNMDGKFCYALL